MLIRITTEFLIRQGLERVVIYMFYYLHIKDG